LTESQANRAQDAILEKISSAFDTGVYRELSAALNALPTTITDDRARQTMDQIFQRALRRNVEFSELAKVLQALTAKLRGTEVTQTLGVLLKQIGSPTEPEMRLTLATALQTMKIDASPQLTETVKVATASLAWSGNDREAAEWARALVALSHTQPNRDATLAAAIVYPASAGPATEILLDAIRAGRSDAPAKEAGTEPALIWLQKAFPDVLRGPLCPAPPQSDLKCP
jgi:hypothetical protein